MKILERKTRIIKRYVVTCNHCGSKLECDENDFYFAMSHGSATVICPVCDYATIVREEDEIEE